MKKIIILCLMACIACLYAQSQILVDKSATGLNNGQTWDNAYTDLQTALQNAVSGDEIWVASGTYYPTSGVNRNFSFEPPSGIKLLGGFKGTESAPEQRNWQINPTILSGDIGVEGDSTDNSFCVVFLHEPDTNTIIDGFIIKDGVADNTAAPSFARGRCGGGMYIMGYDAEAYPDIQNCTFLHNTALQNGAGAMAFGAGMGSVAPRFINCRFESNHAVTGNGGGYARFGGSWLERGDDLEGCVFYRNRAGFQGGGFYYKDSERSDDLDIHGCMFEENEAIDNGGGLYLLLGRGNPAGVSVINCSFTRNIADHGGALILYPNSFLNVNSVHLDSCSFIDNKYRFHDFNDEKAVVSIQLFGANNAIGIINNCIYQNNSNWNLLAYIECSDFTTTCENLLASNNDVGGGFYIQPNSLLDMKAISLKNNKFEGYLISNVTGTGFISYANCIITGNISTVPTYYILNLSSDTLKFTNCTFADNTIPQLDMPNASTYKTATNCIFSGSINKKFFLSTNNHAEYSYCHFDELDCQSLGPTITCGPNNLIGLDPLFRDTANNDYSLLPCSPLIDAGSNAAAAGLLTDISGAPRIQGGTVDIGAYESPTLHLSDSTQIRPACESANGGSISLVPDYGCGPFDYQWDPPVSSGPTANDLAPGDYSFTITDSRGQVFSDTFSIGAASNPQLTPIPSNLQCGNPIGGQATITITNGTAPYTFHWNNNAGDSLLTMLPAGQYSVTVTDTNGCQDSTDMTITQSGQITLSVNGEPISCFGETDAMLSATPANGKAPFSYLWSQGSMDSVLTNLGEGQYIITVTDAYDCTATYSFQVSEPGLLQAQAEGTPTSSLQTPNGTASVIFVNGGTQNYSYNWSNGSSGQTITGLTTGIYTVTVTDAHGCTTTATAEVKFMVGTGELSDLQVQVWPNPMHSWLEIHANNLPSGDWRFILRDALGREVRSEIIAGGRALLDIGGIPGGIYDWSLTNGLEVVQSGKVVK